MKLLNKFITITCDHRYYNLIMFDFIILDILVKHELTNKKCNKTLLTQLKQEDILDLNILMELVAT